MQDTNTAPAGTDGGKALFTGALIALIFGIDYLIPVGYTDWLLYLAPIISTFRIRRPGASYIAAALISALMILEMAVGRYAIPFSVVLFNGGLGIIALWGVAFAVDRFKALLLSVRQAQEKLRESEKILGTFFSNTPVGLIVYGDDNRYVRINDYAAKFYGLRPDDARGKSIHEVLPPDLAAATEQRNRAVLETNQAVSTGVYGARLPLNSPGAATTYWLGVRFPVPLPGGTTGVGVFTLDVTERILAEEAVRRSRDELRTITDNSPDVIARFDRDLRHIFINPYGEKVYGRKRHEILGRTNSELGMPPDKAAFLKKHLDEVFASGRQQTVEFSFDSPAFSHQYFLSIFVPEFGEKGDVRSILAITRDITRFKEVQKHLSDAVREARRRADEAEEGRRVLDALMANIPEGIMVTDDKGRILRMSDFMCRITGYEESETAGKPFTFIDKVLGEPAGIERRRSGGGGEKRAAAAVAEASSEYPVQRALERGEVTTRDERPVYLPDGSSISVVINAAPYRDERGTIIGAVTTWRDITDRKKAEEATQSANRELEQFAYVASHDLQEPLRMVASFTELLERRYRDSFDERGRKYLHYIIDGARRMQNLIQDLLTFSRIGRLDTERRRVDLNRVADTVIADVGAAIGETHAEVTHGPLPAIIANESSMVRLFMNLVSNALKFRKKDVPPEVRISAERKAGEWRFSVSDNGIGIDPRYFGKIFVIFQRLHGREEYPGTGMGLAICKKIVENYGGRIWVESEPGKGTTFHFTVPQ